MVSLAEPMVWFQLPDWRSGSSLVTAPEDEAVKPGPLSVAWDASYSAWPLFCLAWPSASSPELPVTRPITFWTAPTAESR